MGNKSGIESVIALPKGGGAIQGLGESFTPDLFTGTGNLSVPLALPSGRNGLQPQLTLSYSTGAGGGPFGIGWGLSVQGISRKTSKGIPTYNNDATDGKADIFMLSGSEDLVPVARMASRTEYRPRTEGTFARIVHHHDVGNDYWEVTTKDGLVSIHGTPGRAGDDPAVIANPLNPFKVFHWSISETRDLFGNRVVYEYQHDAGEDGPHRWNQLYLKTIRYADYTDPDNRVQFLASVTLQYEDRPDPFSAYRSGFEIRTTKRCVRIETHTHAKVQRLTRVYHFTYLDQRETAGQTLPANGASVLSLIRVTGHDGDATEELPPLEFSYTAFEPRGRRFFPLTGRGLPPRSLSHPDFELADLFGRGLPDVLEMNGVVRYWRNRGNGEYDQPREMKDAPAGLRLADPGVQMLDADGDGRIDLMATIDGLAGFFPLRPDGQWDRRSFRRYRSAPSFNLEDPEVRLLDLDGDGVTDAVRSGSRFEYFFNNPVHGWDEVRTATRLGLDDFPNVQFSDPRVRFGDMTGDGLLDIVLLHDGNIEYWPNLGHGRWGKRINMRNSPLFPPGYDPRRILLGDVDGDGLADIVYVDDGEIHLKVNQGGNAWGAAIVIDGTPRVTDMDSVRLADMLGAGTPGVLWSTDLGVSRHSLLFLDMTGGVKPYLLDTMDNHRGAVTRVHYETSTHFYLEDERRASTRWKTTLPFPVQVVSGVDIVDEITGSMRAIEYSYHHGYFDGAEREFRGFARVEQRDTQSASAFHGTPGVHGVAAQHFSPTLLTKAWFHQGPVGDEFGDWQEPRLAEEYWAGDPPVLERSQEFRDFLLTLPRRVRRDAIRTLRGAELRTEVYALDASGREDRPYTVTESQFGIRDEFGPTSGGTSSALSDVEGFYPHLVAKRTTQWERGNDPMSQFEFAEDYDDLGQCRLEVAIACPRGWRGLPDRVPESTPFIATCARTDFARPPTDALFIRDRAARTTTFELPHIGDVTLPELKAQAAAPSDERILSQTLTFYDGEAFNGLPFGEVGAFGAAVRTETLACNEATLRRAYEEGDGATGLPPYLIAGVEPAWTPDYPEAFRSLAPLAGYVFHDGSGPQTRGFYIREGTRFDFHAGPAPRGLTLSRRRPLGGESHVVYDSFSLMPTTAIDALGLERHAEYDYRAMQPRLVTDTNGNRTAFAFSPLGFLKSVAAFGKEGEAVGDTPDAPSMSMEYDFLAFANSPPEARRPIYIRTILREHHAHEENVPVDERNRLSVRVEFSDGFGRVIQVRALAQDVRFGSDPLGADVIPLDQATVPGPSRGRVVGSAQTPSVIVSGLQLFDNKGQVVEQYEPFFSTGFDFSFPEAQGAKAIMSYDPRGQLVRTVNPDGSVRRVVFGVPARLDTPDDYEPTPWEAYNYDANDSAAEFSGAHHVDPSHLNTPNSLEIDALGRVVRNTAREGPAQADLCVIHTSYDASGNQTELTDPFGRAAFSVTYDLCARALREERMDGGVRRVVFDADGREIERRDGKGALVLQAYDASGRPTRLWARDGPGLPITLRQRLVYGDAAGVAQPATRNLVGRLHVHMDEAGITEYSEYDFKGNLTRQRRRVLSDEELLSRAGVAGFAPYQVDWDDSEQQNALDPFVYQTDTTFDALGRVTRIVFPEDVSGTRKSLIPSYGRNDALARLDILHSDGRVETFLSHVAYNARSQRTLVAYGNGVMTRYAYDAGSFQIARLRSERFVREGELDFVPVGGLLQDSSFERDLVGNITRIRERAPGVGVPGTPQGVDALDREFRYDPLYRLVSATGREHALRNPSADFWRDELFPTPQDATQTRAYTREYAYDRADTLKSLRHVASGAGSFTRAFATVANSNRATAVAQGGDFTLTYDANGNLTKEATSRHFHWNHSDRLLAFQVRAGDGPPSLEAVYAYDAFGQRIKKVVRTQGGRVSSVTYVNNAFEHHRDGQQQNNSLHVWDVTSRVATLRVGAAFDGDEGPAVQYFLEDHIHNTSVVSDDSGGFVRREEFYPYGGTSFGSFARKRYRFTGKERDEESGLAYHRARYYAPALSRWVSADPAGAVDGLNLYCYGRNNPVRFFDHSGKQSTSIPGQSSKPGPLPWWYQSVEEMWTEQQSSNDRSWIVGAAKWVAGKGKWLGQKYWQAQWWIMRKPTLWTWGAMKVMGRMGANAASTIWNAAKDHKVIAAGVALGVAAAALFAGKKLWNWVLAPAIRITTNAAIGYAMFGKWWGALAGGVMGAVHGFAMAKAGTYDWGSGKGWLYFIADNTWSLFNSFVGSAFATANVGWNSIDEPQSKGSNSLYFKTQWFSPFDTTLGNVTVGLGVPGHEGRHAWQGRLLGPAYIPGVISSYEVATVLPYWKLYGHCTVDGIKQYFMDGVYPNTLNEIDAYNHGGSTRCY